MQILGTYSKLISLRKLGNGNIPKLKLSSRILAKSQSKDYTSSLTPVSQNLYFE